jgi:hypothetical protein
MLRADQPYVSPEMSSDGEAAHIQKVILIALHPELGSPAPTAGPGTGLGVTNSAPELAVITV